jgi:competence protein ComEA
MPIRRKGCNMAKKREIQRFGFHVLGIAGILVALLLIIGNAPSYAQAQKAAIDLNSASEKELESIKGVGPATAKKIIAGRPYKSVDELSKAGISAKTVEEIKPFVKVGPASATAAPAEPATKAPAAKPAPGPAPSTPAPQKAATPSAPAAKAAPSAPAKLAPGQKVNINTASKEQLDALPEIGPVKAQAIIDGRPYSKPEDIMKVKGIKQGTYNKIKDFITTE